MVVLPALSLIRCMVFTYAELGEAFSYHSGPFLVSYCLISGWSIAIAPYNRLCFPKKSDTKRGSFPKKSHGACRQPSYRVPLPPGPKEKPSCVLNPDTPFSLWHSDSHFSSDTMETEIDIELLRSRYSIHSWRKMKEKSSLLRCSFVPLSRAEQSNID